MKVNGTATMAAPPDQVYAALVDPAVLAATIPGCQALQMLAEDRYAMSVVAGVASIKGAYDGEVSVSDQEPPRAFTLRAKGSGAPGTVDATVRVVLDDADGGTVVTYDADAAVGGMVGGVGQRMLSGVSRKMATQFFANVDDVIAHGLPSVVVSAPAPEVPAPVPVGAPAAAAAPARTAADDMRVPFWVVLAGVGAGAFWALAGVVVGWAVSRRRS